MLRFCFYLLLTLILAACEPSNQVNEQGNAIPRLSGPYLGQAPPGNQAKRFAPGVISTAMYTRDIAMTPEGNEIYFCVSTAGLNLIFYTKQIDGQWTEPAVAPFISSFNYMYYEPHITPDGSRMLFLSNKPSADDAQPNEDIWAVNRVGDGWGVPYNLGSPVCTADAEYFPSVTRDGTLYFSRQTRGEQATYIYRSRLSDGVYQKPEKLGPQVNCGTSRYNAFIDPDERFIIVPALGMKDSRGGTDYYIVFRDQNDHWNEPINMGDQVNSKSGREYSGYISPDGKYFFFMTAKASIDDASLLTAISYKDLLQMQCDALNGNADIYWIDAGFINELKEK